MIALAYYLLKVMICSAILFLYYYAALRNKLFHQWNRFYLLAAVLLSLIAPIIEISIVHHSTEETNKAIQLLQVIQGNDYLDEIVVSSQPTISTAQWAAMFYALVSFIFLLSMIFSLLKIFSIIKSHTVQWLKNIRFINTNIKGTPFSFFHFIFWNEKIDLQTGTGQQIFQHELVHVKEKHTLDKLFLQTVLIVFWCNPIFWLVRRELKIIHEFIADKKAVGEQGTAALATMILNSFYPSHFTSLTNPFFQTSIKRRLAMLTKTQNPKINYISRMLALPIIALTVLAFTLRTKNVITSTIKSDKQIIVVIDAGHGLMQNGNYSGAKEGNIYEDVIALSIAQKIQQLNADKNLKIVLTRASDNIVDLQKRVDIAKENNADLFISLHVNAAVEKENPNNFSNKTLNKGFEIYVSNKQPFYQQQSELLGSVLQEELNTVHFTNPTLLKRQAGVWVIDQNVCPSVLIECGFITNKNDKEFITKEENQNAVAQKILMAIERYESQKLNWKSTMDTIPANKKTSSGKYHIKVTGDFKLDKEETPLYILDGKEVTKARLSKINPSDIESINVLKNKSAINKYGALAKNGAIEVRLKKTKSDEKAIIKTDGQPFGEGTFKLNLKNKLEFDGTINTDKLQEDTLPIHEPVFTKTEIRAGIEKEKWQNFLHEHLLPVIKQGISKGAVPGTYTVKVKFIIGKDGSVSDFKALNDPGFGFAKEVVDMMKYSPKWLPAIQNGKPVRSFYVQPVTIVIQEQ